MKHVRTVRGYEALNAEAGGKPYAITRVSQEVSDSAAAELAKIGEAVGVALEVLDEAPEDAASASTAAVNSRPVDLSAGRAAISGGGQPVPTFEGAADQSAEAPAEGDAQGDAAAATTTTTTTSTSRKGN